jgi:hypothetical protein
LELGNSKKVSAAEIHEPTNIETDSFHGEWNHVIKPRRNRRSNFARGVSIWDRQD